MLEIFKYAGTIFNLIGLPFWLLGKTKRYKIFGTCSIILAGISYLIESLYGINDGFSYVILLIASILLIVLYSMLLAVYITKE